MGISLSRLQIENIAQQIAQRKWLKAKLHEKIAKFLRRFLETSRKQNTIHIVEKFTVH